MKAFSKIVFWLNKAFLAASGAALVGMIFLTCANVFLRLFGKPVFGTYELMGFFGALSTAFALGYAKIRNAHISVDILVLSYRPVPRKIVQLINAVIVSVFFAIIAWQMIKYGNVLRRTGDVTDTLQIIYYPFVYATAAGCGFLSLIYVEEFLQKLLPGKESEK